MAQNDYYSHGNEAHTAEYFAQRDNTISNGAARIPICFCIDTSQSMQNVIGGQTVEIPGTRRFVDGQWVVDVKPKYPGQELVSRIKQLRIVMKKMIQKMQMNPIISTSAVICLITFDRFADCYVEFTDVGYISTQHAERINIGADQTNAAKGLQMALERLDQQQRMNSDAGNDCYRPVLIFLSDGFPTDKTESNGLRDEVRQRSEDGKLNVIPIGIVSGIDEQWMRSLSRESIIYRMEDDHDFERVFELITRRIERTTMVISIDEDTTNMTQAVSELEDSNCMNTQYGNNVDANAILSEFLAFSDEEMG